MSLKMPLAASFKAKGVDFADSRTVALLSVLWLLNLGLEVKPGKCFEKV